MAKAARLEEILDSSLRGPVFGDLTLESIDPDGALRACVRAVIVHVATHQPVDMVLHRGPGSPWGLRVIADEDYELKVLPVRIGSANGQGAVSGANSCDDEEGLDFSRAAELAAAMWQNR